MNHPQNQLRRTCNLVLPSYLHDAVSEICYRQNISMTKFVTEALKHNLDSFDSQALDRDDKNQQIFHTTVSLPVEVINQIRKIAHYHHQPKMSVTSRCIMAELERYPDVEIHDYGMDSLPKIK